MSKRYEFRCGSCGCVTTREYVNEPDFGSVVVCTACENCGATLTRDNVIGINAPTRHAELDLSDRTHVAAAKHLGQALIEARRFSEARALIVTMTNVGGYSKYVGDELAEELANADSSAIDHAIRGCFGTISPGELLTELQRTGLYPTLRKFARYIYKHPFNALP